MEALLVKKLSIFGTQYKNLPIFQGIKLLIQISIKENIAGPMCPLYRAIFVYHNDVTGHIVNRPAIRVWLGMARQEGKYNYYCIFKVEEAG